MKKFLKNKSKNQSQENTIRKIKQNNTVDKKEQTYIMKNIKEIKLYKENKRDKSKDNVHKIKSDKATEKNKTKTIELNFGFIILKIIVIVLLALLITTLTAKTVMTKIGTKESISETESDVQSIDDSSNYTITVTEYTGDTLEAECSYEDGVIILYVVDANSWEQLYVKQGEVFLLNEILEGLSQGGYNYSFSALFLSGPSTTISALEGDDDGRNDATTSSSSWALLTTDAVDGTSELYVSLEQNAWGEYYYYITLILNGNTLYDASGGQEVWASAAVVMMVDADAVRYTIAFDGNGADDGEMESIEATYDEEYTLTENAFTREGYKFTGWNTEADGSGTSYEDGATVSNLTTTDGDTVTLYAQWEAKESYTIVFDGNGAQIGEIESIIAYIGEEATLPSTALHKARYRFVRLVPSPE